MSQRTFFPGYCIDTNALIDLWRRFYPSDIFPSLWKDLEDLISENCLIAPREVLSELEKWDDELLRWAKKHKKMFKDLDYDQLQEVSDHLSGFDKKRENRNGRLKTGGKMRLKDKVAIVTGGARGIGRAYALCLAEEGAKVVIADILDGSEVVHEIKKRGAEVLALHTDVTDEQSTQEMAQKTVERFGRIDILINNAAFGSSIVKKSFHQISAEEWDTVIGVNLKGPFLCSKAVYPQMKKQHKGKIINVSSGTFFKGLPRFLHYVTSKGGVIGFTRALAQEVGDDGICVNTIVPGYTETEILKEKPLDPEGVIKAIVASRCIKRTETPEDLTGTIIFLASDDSDFITGQAIIVDGGSAFN